MKKYWMLAPVLCLCPAVGSAQTMQEILSDGKNTDNVLNHSMGLDRKSYSALKQINNSNIKRLDQRFLGSNHIIPLPHQNDLAM
jgi:hypothetical protein